MTILITGATGFIGSHLIKFLKQQEYKIYALLGRSNSIPEDDEVEWISDKQLSKLYEQNLKINVIIHLATHFTSKHSWEDIDGLINTNIKLGVKLLEIAKIHDSKFINTSSFAQKIGENYQFPQNLYAQTKKSFQDILRYYCSNEEITAIDLELFDSYGLNDNRNKFYKLALNDFMNNSDFKMSKGEQEICLIHVDDIIKAIEICISLHPKLLSYNAFTLLNKGQTYILKELAFELRRICESSSFIETGFYDYRKNEIFKLESEYKPLPGWNPKVSLSQGITEILKDKK